MRITKSALAYMVMIVATTTVVQSMDRGYYAGVIDQVTGSNGVCIMTNTATRQSICRSPEDAQFFQLFEYDQIRCPSGSVVTVDLRYGTETNFTSTDWVPVPLERDPKDADPRVRMAALAVEGLRPSNRERGDGMSPVFQPANDSSVRLENEFVIRWVPATTPMRLNLELFSTLSNFAWQTNLDATVGLVPLPGLLQRLKQERDSGAGQFTLRSRMGSGPSITLTFKVLSVENETKLDAELQDAVAGYDLLGAIPHLIRAALLNRYHLFNESTEEYDRALRSPGESTSIGLLERAKDANEQIGNTPRAIELELRLKELDGPH